MATGIMQVEVLAPNEPMAKVQASSVTVPGALGYIGILPGHTPLIAELGIGELTVTTTEGAKPLSFFVSGGYVEVIDDHVTVLVSVVETPKSIDEERAKKAKQRAEGRLANINSEVDLKRAQGALARASGRLLFLERHRLR